MSGGGKGGRGGSESGGGRRGPGGRRSGTPPAGPGRAWTPPGRGRDTPPRDASGAVPRAEAVVIYGRNAVREALTANLRPVRSVWATAGTAGEPWLRGVDVQITTSEEIAARCGSEGHQGVCAAAGRFPYADAMTLLGAHAPLLVALDEVQDVQNLGSIVRTAECAGATGLIIPERRSAEVTPAAGKASAGAIEHLPIARVKNLADFLGQAKDAGLWVYGAAGETGAQPWTAIDWTGGVVLVMGAEGKGLRPRVAGMCDALVALPVRGRIDSLNVGAAAAALLYEALRIRA